MPAEVLNIARDRPLIYFAMGSSGTPEIVARILESFEGKPYRVIAPIRFQMAQVAGARVPSNVLVTDWLPALQVNRMADLAVIHGGIGTVMTAALPAGRWPEWECRWSRSPISPASNVWDSRSGFENPEIRPPKFKKRFGGCWATTTPARGRQILRRSQPGGMGRSYQPRRCCSVMGGRHELRNPRIRQ